MKIKIHKNKNNNVSKTIYKMMIVKAKMINCNKINKKYKNKVIKSHNNRKNKIILKNKKYQKKYKHKNKLLHK